jgi:hypothetical protein
MRFDARLLYVCLFLVPFGIQAQESPDDLTARGFYPHRLDDVFRATHGPDDEVIRKSRSLRVDLDKSGHADYLAVAYSNGLACELRIIKGSELSNASLVAESPDKTMGGDGGPLLEAVDIDHDGVPELVVHFVRATWVYKYEHERLTLYGPTRRIRGGVTSALSEASFVDVDGDDVLEILDDTSTGQYAGNVNLYKLGADRMFSRVSTVQYFSQFVSSGDSATTAPDHSFTAKPGKYLLRVVRGEGASGGEIRLNGAIVAGSGEFHARGRVVEVPVELLDSNDLNVAVDGDGGAQLTVTIVPAR